MAGFTCDIAPAEKAGVSSKGIDISARGRDGEDSSRGMGAEEGKPTSVNGKVQHVGTEPAEIY